MSYIIKIFSVVRKILYPPEMEHLRLVPFRVPIRVSFFDIYFLKNFFNFKIINIIGLYWPIIFFYTRGETISVFCCGSPLVLFILYLVFFSRTNPYWTKATVFFFFRGKVWGLLTNSFWGNFVFFPTRKKKQPNSGCFFFPLEKFTSYLLTQIREREKKKQLGKKTAFLLTRFFPKSAQI